MADTSDESKYVALEAHPGAASIAQSATSEFVRNLFDAHEQSRGESLDDDTERRTVTLTRREEAQHCPILG